MKKEILSPGEYLLKRYSAEDRIVTLEVITDEKRISKASYSHWGSPVYKLTTKGVRRGEWYSLTSSICSHLFPINSEYQIY